VLRGDAAIDPAIPACGHHSDNERWPCIHGTPSIADDIRKNAESPGAERRPTNHPLTITAHFIGRPHPRCSRHIPRRVMCSQPPPHCDWCASASENWKRTVSGPLPPARSGSRASNADRVQNATGRAKIIGS